MDFGHMYGLYGHYVASVPLIVFMTMSLMVQLTACSTHWVLSDDGRLKSVDFSPYVMRDSGDLINLMKQEQRVGESIHLEKQKEKLMTELRIMTLKANDQRLQRKAESSDDPDAYDENDAQSVQKNCAPMFSEGKEKERSLMELDHYYSITLPLALFGISLSEHLGTYHKASLTPQPPNCGEHRQLTHVNNIHQFTNLRGMKESKDFVLRPEPSLRAIFSHQPLDQVGHIIQKSLQQNSESWVTYNLATLFWRIKGNSQEALKCVSHAIDLSPDDALAISLLHMAAILHKHYYHADGQFVAWVALENCKERAKGFIHMFLANVQCLPTLNQFDNCVESLNAILQSENFQLDETKGLTLHSGVKEKIKAVQCIRHFRAIVEREQSVLAEIVAKERELQTVSEELSEKHKEIESFKISDEEILMKEHYYRMYTNKQFNQMMEFVKKVKSTTQGTNALLHSLNPNINVEHLRDKRTRNEQQWGSFDLQGDENVPSLEHFKSELCRNMRIKHQQNFYEIEKDGAFAPVPFKKIETTVPLDDTFTLSRPSFQSPLIKFCAQYRQKELNLKSNGEENNEKEDPTYDEKNSKVMDEDIELLDKQIREQIDSGFSKQAILKSLIQKTVEQSDSKASNGKQENKEFSPTEKVFDSEKEDLEFSHGHLEDHSDHVLFYDRTFNKFYYSSNSEFSTGTDFESNSHNLDVNDEI